MHDEKVCSYSLSLRPNWFKLNMTTVSQPVYRTESLLHSGDFTNTQ